jgi:DNA-binding NarL/FixJ family response regulator
LLVTFYKHRLNVGNEEKVRKRLTPERRQQILELRQQGKGWKEIAETVGVSVGTIYFAKLHKEVYTNEN